MVYIRRLQSQHLLARSSTYTAKKDILFKLWTVHVTLVSFSTVNSRCLPMSALCAGQRVPSAVSAMPNHPFVVGRRWSRRPCHHAWTTVTASWSELLAVWCDGCRQSWTPLHVWSPALGDETTSRQFSGSFIGCLSVNVSSSSWPC